METKDYLKMLKELREDWEDEIPKEIVSNQGKYKCRNNWFQAIFLAVGESERLGWLEEMTRTFNKHVVNYFNQTKLPARLKTPSDIRLGNYLLDIAIHDLEDVLGINPLGAD